MAAQLKGISLVSQLQGAGRRVGIVHTQWNAEVVDALVGGAREELLKHGVKTDDIVTISVRAVWLHEIARRRARHCDGLAVRPLLARALPAAGGRERRAHQHGSSSRAPRHLHAIAAGPRLIRAAVRRQVLDRELARRRGHLRGLLDQG